MKKNNYWQRKKILITGGSGFIGSNFVSHLINNKKVLQKNLLAPDKDKINLMRLEDCLQVTKNVDLVIHFAGDIGGLGYSREHPAQQLYNCSIMDLNIVESSRINNVSKIILISCSPAFSSSIQPPYKESSLFDGEIDKSHLGLGWAKRSLVVIAECYRMQYKMNITTLICNNTYGPRDNFALENAHVIPSLISKCFHHNELKVWGDGKEIRDFIYIADLIKGITLAAETETNSNLFNLASGERTSIKKLVEIIVQETAYTGKVVYEKQNKGGQDIRILDISRAKKELNFQPKYKLSAGIKETVSWYKDNIIYKYSS